MVLNAPDGSTSGSLLCVFPAPFWMTYIRTTDPYFASSTTGSPATAGLADLSDHVFHSNYSTRVSLDDVLCLLSGSFLT